MRLLRFGAEGSERVGIQLRDEIRDLSAHLPRLAGEALDPRSLAALRSVDPATLPLVDQPARLGPCIEPTGKIVCVGLNYADHAAEAGLAAPSEPVLFMKGCRVTGPEHGLWLPPGASSVDWEIELAIVIGRYALSIGEDAAVDHVAGYAAFIDFSERAWQLSRQGQWVKGKSWPTFAPLGPWLVTPDEIADVQTLPIWLDVNGERMQDTTTASMIVSARKLVSYISAFMPLYPGDVIATGTPAGVGMGKKPPRYLADGDEVRAGIEGLGEQRHRCKARPQAHDIED